MINHCSSSAQYYKDPMIRHSLTLRPSNSLKNAWLSCYLPGFSDGDCVKLTQGQDSIYLIYRQAEDMSHKHAEVNSIFLELNGLNQEGICVAEAVSPIKAQHLIVQVSELDWKIINHRQDQIAQSFLEQVNFVWPKSKIPIFYEGNNYVVLNILCEKVSKLEINTTIEFIQKKMKEQVRQKQQKQDQQIMLHLKRQHQSRTVGYMNKITVSQKIFDDISRKMSKNGLWTVTNATQFSSCPSIHQLLALEKKKEEDKEKKQYNPKKLVILQKNDNLSDDQYECSQESRQILDLSEQINMSDAEQYQPKIINLSFQIFLNDINLNLNICEIIDDQSLYSQIRFNEEKEKIMNLFVNHLLNILFSKQPFTILQTAYPYSFQRKLLLLSISSKKDSKFIDKFYNITLVGKETVAKREQFTRKLLNSKINFTSQMFNSPELKLSIGERYDEIEKWVKIIHLHRQNQIKKNEDDDKLVIKFFENIYRQQIEKIQSFIEDSKKDAEKIILLTAFGSNGKTLMHQILVKSGLRLWKIDFRLLNNPQLNIKDIDFYLQWIIANSPYPTLYLDNLDALCSRIDESDQHRKKQKIISKIILRKLNSYLDIHKRRCIVTAKSESSLDQQMVKCSTVMLKNPSRQLRETSLKKIYMPISIDDSPIKSLKIESQKVTDIETIQKVADSTESLTFAAFSMHAISLTVPTSAKTTKIFDFSKLAGLHQAKSTIRSIIQKPIKYAFLFKSVPIKLPRGILLYGATGNGKSALGVAAQDEFKMKYFNVKGSDILSKYIGGSEAAVRQIFEKALSVSPSIIFFDEFESIVPRRSSNNSGVNDRIVNQFLCYLDGVSSITGVYIIAASSRPDLIDPAILRPGRLDAHLFLDYPAPEQRLQLIRLFGNSVKIAVDEQEVVNLTEKFSYSDLIGLFKELRIKRSSQVLKMENYSPLDFLQIDDYLFRQTISNFKLSVNEMEQQRQRKIYEAFSQGTTPDIGKQKQVLQ